MPRPKSKVRRLSTMNFFYNKQLQTLQFNYTVSRSTSVHIPEDQLENLYYMLWSYLQDKPKNINTDNETML